MKGNNYQTVTVYDAWNNKAETYTLEGNKLSLTLEPGEAVFLCFDNFPCSDNPGRGRYLPKLTGQQPLSLDWKLSRRAELGTEYFGETLLKAGEGLPNLNGPGYWPAFTGTYRYVGGFTWQKESGVQYMLLIPEASDSVRVCLNGIDLGYQAGFPARVDITEELVEGENRLVLDVASTLVWKRKDGASTHLQVQATGITRDPVIQRYE